MSNSELGSISKEDVLSKAEKEDVKFIKLHFSDIFGNIKSVTISSSDLGEAFDKGVWFDGSSIEGFARIAESDMYLMPDPSTFAVLPWRPKEKGVARIICDVYTPDAKHFEGDPRYVLRRATQKAEEMGYEFNVGPELEFFLFKFNGADGTDPVPQDVGGYFDYAPRDLASDVRRDIIFGLESMGLKVETSHHECAPGQHEIDFRYGPSLQQADKTITFKYVTKSIAHSHGLHASFMPKPAQGMAGSGMHTHQSLFDTKTRENVFYDKNDEYKLSKIARYFIAGQLAHAKEMSAILSPTVNSYKRLVPGYEAPVYICWAQINRSSLIRIPRISPGREKGTRAEIRCPDPSCNPYLAFAAMLSSGLDGIKNKAELPAPVNEDVYKLDLCARSEKEIDMLPYSLWQALKHLKKSSLMKETLGQHLFERYIEGKTAEWDDYRIAVTDWETKRYFDVL